jgi:SPX domain protein involved in polyphosphate accumulation
MSGVPDHHRYERKFAITGASLTEVEHCVRHHPALFFSEYTPRTVNNIYLDSPDLRNYQQNVDGHSHRAKLRARWYGALFGTVPKAVLEQKCKRGQLGTKQSARLTPFEFGNQTSARTVRHWLAASSLPANLHHETQRAEPTLVNQYRRQYFRSADRRVRLTIDSALAFFRFRRHENSFLARIEVPALVVVELKYADAASEQATMIANHLPFRMTRMSKYVFGLNAVGGV